MTEEEIYGKDKLQRKNFCKKISSFVQGYSDTDKGLVITINGGYGSGKTTCLRMIEKEFLKDEMNTVVYYDCWKNSIVGDPLISIIYTLLRKLPKDTIGKIVNVSNKLLKYAAKIVSTQAKVPLPVKGKTIFNEIETYEKVVEEFKTRLTEIIGSKGRIIILFDEIDRCLPNQAIEILERINHIFDISGLTAIIAVDTNQIEKAIENIFGNYTNVSAYIAKFIDFAFDLPYNKRQEATFLQEKYNLKSGVQINSIFDAFGIELRSKIKMLDFAQLCCESEEQDYKKIMVYALALSMKMKDKIMFNKIFGNINEYTIRNKMAIAGTKSNELFEYLEAKHRLDNNTTIVLKKIFLSWFGEIEYLNDSQIEYFLSMGKEQLDDYIFGASNQLETLKEIINNINDLSNVGVAN